MVGVFVGDELGFKVLSVGDRVGALVAIGIFVGNKVGIKKGGRVGKRVGFILGLGEGDVVGM